MKDHLRQLVSSAADAEVGWAIAREYMQARILQELQRAGAMTTIAFHGGSALRFLYGIQRWSEDLVFALEGNPDGYDFEQWLRKAAAALRAEAYDVEVKLNMKRVVHSAFVRFGGLPHELGLSGHREQVLAVKVEIDTNPPAGATCATTVIRRHVLLNLFHHDSASLFAGKLHAVLQRPYAKGRDVYDLVWYLADRDHPDPDLEMLGNALAQSGWRGPTPSTENWRSMVMTRVRELDWAAVEADVRPFVEDPAELELLTRDHIARLLER